MGEEKGEGEKRLSDGAIESKRSKDGRFDLREANAEESNRTQLGVCLVFHSANSICMT